MIIVNNAIVKPSLLANNTIDYTAKNKILTDMYEKNEVFVYSNVQQLEYDVALRYHLTTGSKKLFSSGIKFRDFHTSYCNPLYWSRTFEGGFRLLPNRKASEGILDIFNNGVNYGTECATAIMILFYYAFLNTMKETQFNQIFQNLYLYTWSYSNNVQLKTVYQKSFTYGDVIYFKNPDVHPLTPQWQGENAVYLGDNLFYGHGAGISTPNEIIEKLNRNRIPRARRSAFKTDHVTRINSVAMSDYADKGRVATTISLETLHQRDFALLQIGNFHEVLF